MLDEDVQLSRRSIAPLTLQFLSFLDLVESRLATVEDEVRLLKGQLSDLSYAAPRAEGPRVCTAADQVSGAHEDEQANGKSPDATDGVGTVEFVDEDNWAYFGTFRPRGQNLES